MTPSDEKRLKARFRELVERSVFMLGEAVDVAKALKWPTGILEGVCRTLRRLLDDCKEIRGGD